MHVFGPQFFWGSAPLIFGLALSNTRRFRSGGKVSGRSVEGTRRTRGEKKHHERFISPPVTTVNGRPNNSNNFNHWVLRNTELTQCRPYVVNRPRPTQFVYRAFDQSGSAVFGASLLKFVLFEMYNYLINFRPVLLGAPLQLGALSARLVRLWVNPALARSHNFRSLRR